MTRVLNFYMDDSGTRHPDHNAAQPAAHGHDWFALGGILLWEDEEDALRDRHAAFCAEWQIDYPLHSVEIRHRAEPFRWLRDPKKHKAFMESLTKFVLSLPVMGVACVIDRPGYNHRYLENYGRDRWSLCKTAFAIAVERATKYAIGEGARLRVRPERCNRKEDRKLEEYYQALRAEGHPFSQTTAGKYKPLAASDYSATLYEFEPKAKTSPPIQIADLFLWPICMGGYHRSNLPYRLLVENSRLIDCKYSPEDQPMLGIKYSCFDLVEVKA